jgi:cysteine desulfurase family protein
MSRAVCDMVYLDNAATSFPKAPGVVEAVCDNIATAAGSAGRGEHTFAVAADKLLWDVRRELAALLGTREITRWALTFNATDALNAALKGYLRPGDHVLASALEHNAVARPLRYLEASHGISLTKLPYVPGMGASPTDVRKFMQPSTRLLVLVHASNVTGEILPVRELAVAAHDRDVPVLIDATQSAGSLPLDIDAWGLDMVAATGHKALLGPQGTGALYVRPGLDILPLRQGGTGSWSEQDRHPDEWPDKMESGTMNGPGLAGLLVALRWLRERTVKAVRRHEVEVMDHLLHALADLPGIAIYGTRTAADRAGLVSINVAEMDPADVAAALEDRGILARAGLHCAPWAHEAQATLRRGALRLSVGPFTTREDTDAAASALSDLGRSASLIGH